MRKRFTCTTTDGGGTDHDGGIWELSDTPKRMVLQQIEKPWFETPYTRIQVNKPGSDHDGEFRYSGYGNVLIDHYDGTFTGYPDQCGTPYHFEPK